MKPVFLIPGFLARKESMLGIYWYLQSIGYDPYLWDLGRNLGTYEKLKEKLLTTIEDLYYETGKKVVVIGWSLGGVYARNLAIDCPDLIDRVITIASPIADNKVSPRAVKLYQKITREKLPDIDKYEVQEINDRIKVPFTSIYSTHDEIVNYESSLLRESDLHKNIHVIGTHLTMGINPQVYSAIRQAL